MKSLKQFIPGADTSESGKLDPMLAYFLGALDVRLRRLSPTIVDGSDPVRQGALEEIKRASADFATTYVGSANEDAAWNEANRLERLFALVEPSENLWAELKRRLAEAADENVGSTARLVASTDAMAPLVLDPKTPGSLLPGGDLVVRSLLLETLGRDFTGRSRGNSILDQSGKAPQGGSFASGWRHLRSSCFLI